MNKAGISLFALVIAGMLTLVSCKPKQPTASTTVMEDDGPALLVFPGNDTVYKGEFEYVYQKNNGGWDDAKTHTTEQYQEYLDLYINFKRKVLEAEANGLASTDAFKSEFEGYRKQLAQPYLVDKSVQEELIQEAYDRSQTLINAAHILVMVNMDAAPADTLKAYNKIVTLRDSIVKFGKDFNDVARNNSEDPSAKSNAGDLGYFSVFDMVYPFESGAYNTAQNEVSQPVRTGFGYHLIKVADRMENPGKKTAAHLIVRVGPQYSAKTNADAKTRIDELYKELKGGADWRELCRKFSDDPNTNERGGDLGNGRLIPEMENIKRTLGDGEVSEPFETGFGFHIMKVTDVEKPKSFQEAEPEIKNRIARDARSTLSKSRLVARIKRENNFQMNSENVAKLVAHIEGEGQEGMYLKGFYRPVDSTASELYPLPLYTIGEGGSKMTGTIKDYLDFYTQTRKGLNGATVETATNNFMETYTEKAVLEFEEMQLPKKYREYRELLKEYRDGILLFTLTEEKVWRKAVEDTTGLKNYYETHKADFTAGERVVVDEYITDNRDVIDEVEGMLKAGKTQEEITAEINKVSSLRLTVRQQNYERGKSDLIDPMFSQAPGYISPVNVYSNNRFRIFVLKEKLPAGQKSFEDAKSEAITQYQNYLEKEWLKELEGRYPVEVKNEVFDQLFK